MKVLQAAEIRYFQDVLSLDRGQRWEREICRRVDECHVFLLFWWRAAKKSKWVCREADHALKHQSEDAAHLPEIRPVILGTPPIERPWRELTHLHFNDRLVMATSA